MLVYIGIRILIGSTAPDKAKYKERLQDWVVALCLVFVIHIIMSGVLLVTEQITKLFASDTYGNVIVKINGSENGNASQFRTNLIGYARFMVQYVPKGSSDSWGNAVAYTIIYLALIIFTVMFTFTYFKRFLYMAFFTMIAPLVALTYPLDKLADGKAQAFNYWFKEYTMNAIIQPVHLILYSVFVGSAVDMATDNPIYAIIALGALVPVEKIIKKMFGFDKSETTSGLGALAGGALTMQGINAVRAKLSGGRNLKAKNAKKGEEDDEIVTRGKSPRFMQNAHDPLETLLGGAAIGAAGGAVASGQVSPEILESNNDEDEENDNNAEKGRNAQENGRYSNDGEHRIYGDGRGYSQNRQNRDDEEIEEDGNPAEDNQDARYREYVENGDNRQGQGEQRGKNRETVDEQIQREKEESKLELPVDYWLNRRREIQRERETEHAEGQRPLQQSEEQERPTQEVAEQGTQMQGATEQREQVQETAEPERPAQQAAGRGRQRRIQEAETRGQETSNTRSMAQRVKGGLGNVMYEAKRQVKSAPKKVGKGALNGAKFVAKKIPGAAVGTVAGLAGATAAGILSTAAGVASGDLEKGLTMAAGGALGGAALGAHMGARAGNSIGGTVARGASSVRNSYRQGAYTPDELKIQEQEKFDKQFKSNDSNYEYLKNKGMSAKEADEFLKGGGAQAFLDAGITDIGLMYNAQALAKKKGYDRDRMIAAAQLSKTLSDGFENNISERQSFRQRILDKTKKTMNNDNAIRMADSLESDIIELKKK